MDEKELKRLTAMYVYERECFENGCVVVAGVDEVGRGPLAGPVVACALVLPKGRLIEGVNDSKKLTQKKREALAREIRKHSRDIGFGMVMPAEIDRINILNATRRAMKLAVESLRPLPDFVLVDGNDAPPINCPKRTIIKGDGKSVTIAAASVVAKVTRDAIMRELHEMYPVYGFERNMGYGTKAHIEAVKKHGPCPLHRRSFLKKIMAAGQ